MCQDREATDSIERSKSTLSNESIQRIFPTAISPGDIITVPCFDINRLLLPRVLLLQLPLPLPLVLLL
jgi:hypothetical protein